MESLPSTPCRSCNSYCATPEIQRYHYTSDWHRFNMKQLSMNRPLITDREYAERWKEISAFLAKEDELNPEATEDHHQKLPDISVYCNTCRRQFSNSKSHDNHLSSRKHKKNMKKFQQNINNKDMELFTITMKASWPENAKSSDSDDCKDTVVIMENPLGVQDCLFCNHRALDMKDNFRHMSIVHSFFLPDADYCVNPEGLLDYLGKKVAVNHICLGCKNGCRSFSSLDAVRKHMKDKGHCRMFYKDINLVEYVDFYDYSSMDPDHVSLS